MTTPTAEAPRRVPVAAAAGLLGLVFVLGVVSVRFAVPGTEVAAWWPASGVGAGLLLLHDRRHWPLLLGLLVALSAAANGVGGRPAPLSLVYGVVNAAEVLVFCVALGGLRARPSLVTGEDFRRLLVVGLATGLGIGTVAGVVVAVMTDGDPWSTARSVAASHSAALLAVVPVFLRSTPAPGLLERRRAAVVAQLALTAALSAVVFAPGQELPLTFLVVPLVVWGAAVLPVRWLTWQILVISTGVTLMTAEAGGPFGAPESIDAQARGAMVQLFIVTMAVVALPLAIAVQQRRTALEEARAAASALRRERELTSAVLDSATGTAIIGTDPEGVVTYVNPGAEDLLGRPAAALVGSPLTSIYDPEALRARREPGVSDLGTVMRSVVDGSPGRQDWCWVRGDGSQVTVSVATTVLQGDDAAPAGYLAVAHDVSERRAAERTLRAALDREQLAVERLEELDREKSEFVSSVSHELRTPMTSVLGFTQLLGTGAGGPLTDRQRDMIARIDRSGHRLLGLIENILSLSRVESAREEVTVEPCDLREVVAAALSETEALLASRDLTLRTEVPDEPVVVDGERDQLERVLMNLVSNAVKFTGDGGSVDVALTGSAGTAVLRVSDTGVGIPAAEQERLFESFFRASTAISTGVQGTGLGLTIVRTIVEGHGGTVDVTSEEGRGTTFEVRLPTA
ncbi:MAG: ATP-binding protein [Nocardioides marinisabuli]|uniref:sensor histidine kinase n=1 Tax=Nocardioides marinisabuli TaxID=419476 RepID=UPI00321B17C4